MAGARFVVSLIGESLSPKYAPLITAPETIAGFILMVSPIPIKAIPMVAVVPHELPVATLIIAQITRVIITCSIMKFSLDVFINEVVNRIGFVSLFSVLIPMFLYLVLPQNWIRFLILTAACVISVPINIYWFGINSKEKLVVKIKTLQFYNRILNNLKQSESD